MIFLEKLCYTVNDGFKNSIGNKFEEKGGKLFFFVSKVVVFGQRNCFKIFFKVGFSGGREIL